MMWKIDSQIQVEELNVVSAVDALVWVPSEAVSMMHCKVSRQQIKLLDKMIPFALEDQLLEPIEKLHFAFNAKSNDEIPVIVVANAVMEEWQQALQSQEIEPKILLPDIYAVPLQQDKMTIWHESNRCLLRKDIHQGLAGTVEWMFTVAKLDEYQDNLIIYSDNIQALPTEWQQQAEPLPEPLDDRMRQFVIQDVINLLQGNYAVNSPLSSFFGAWRMVAILVLVAVATHLASMFVETSTLQRQITNIQQQTTALYQTIDLSNDTIATRADVEEYVQQLKTYDNKTKNNMWSILPKVDKIISKCRVCRVEKIKLDASEVTIDLRSVGKFSEFKEALLDMQSIKTEYKVIKEEDGYTISQFKFSLA